MYIIVIVVHLCSWGSKYHIILIKLGLLNNNGCYFNLRVINHWISRVKQSRSCVSHDVRKVDCFSLFFLLTVKVKNIEPSLLISEFVTLRLPQFGGSAEKSLQSPFLESTCLVSQFKMALREGIKRHRTIGTGDFRHMCKVACIESTNFPFRIMY